MYRESAYVPPAISSELGGSAPTAATERNPYAGPQVSVMADIDGFPVGKLIEDFGSPLWVFSEGALRRKARSIRAAFDACYNKVRFAWSYKTNYLNAVCTILRQEGWLAEVVSDFEYEKARNLGFSGQDIIFNGPYKQSDILRRAAADGAQINIDNWDELNRIQSLAEGFQRPIDVGVRIWLDAGVRPVWSKFGFALANGEAERACVQVLKNPNLHLQALHTHIGTYILEPRAYHTAAHKLIGLQTRIQKQHRHLISCINLGGGFPSSTLLHGMPEPPEGAPPSIEDYAAAISGVLNKVPPRHRPVLQLESGRSIVDEAGYLLTRVVAVKGARGSHNRRSDLSGVDVKQALLLPKESGASYVVDAGVQLLYNAAWYKYNVYPSRDIKAVPVASTLYGCLCMAIDIIRDSVAMPPLQLGDVLVLHPVGAYNVVQAMQFIQYRPAVVMISENGSADVIRLREDLADVERLERVPAWLAK